ncbi:MAG: CHASE2 domain-containing protein [Pseudomonadota bacterium]
MRNSRLLGEWAVLLLATVSLVLFAWQQQWTYRVDSALLDFALYTGLEEPNDEIVVIAIDDRAVSEVGNWPWDRRRHADLLDHLREYNPALVVFDVLFVDPTTSQSDAELGMAIARAGRIVLPHSFTAAPGTSDALAPLMPLAPFSEAADALGHVAVFPDADGIVRRFELAFETGGKRYDHLAQAAYGMISGQSQLTRQDDRAPIAPMQPVGAFRTASALDVMNETLPREFLDGKVVLIGATAQGLGDRYAVSSYAGRLQSGVEIQASVLSALLNRQMVREVGAPWVPMALISVIVLLFLVFWRFPPKVTLRASLGLIIALAMLSCVSVVFAQVWWPVFPAILGILVAYPIWGWRRLSSVSRFLEVEAAALIGPNKDDEFATGSGFDPVARQVSQMRALIGETRERLTFLRRVLAASPDPMLVFDTGGGLVLMNKRAETIFGSETQQAGVSLEHLLKQQDAGFRSGDQELQLVDGRVFLLASADSETRGIGAIVALRDITGLRASERQRREMLEFLSHDMRSPQAAIVGLVGAAGHALPEGERLARIEKQARRTLKLTDDFVQIARLEYDGVHVQETDLGALLYEAQDRAYPSAKRAQVRLETDIPEEPQFCHVDPSSISRAIDNLLGNAIKFSPPDTVVRIGLARSADQQLVIEISDEGPGLPPPRIEDTYARFGARDDAAGPSAGLGLAYVKRVVDEHGAVIEVETESGKGTRFRIILPAETV